MADRKPIESWLTDMDGVLIHEGVPIPGADAFIKRLRESGRPFLVLTNNSIYTPRDLHARLRRMGLEVPIESIWTSALATAKFLDDQRPGGSAYVIGEAGLTTALHDIGYILTDHEPDYVVLGETRTYSFEAMTKAVRLINAGARFICTNPDETGPSTEGPLPATGAVAALITKATGKQPYFAGKPNPLMMRTGLNAIGAHSETSAMIGDRMDTDVLAGIEGRDADLPRPHRPHPARAGRELPVPPVPGGRLHRGPCGTGLKRECSPHDPIGLAPPRAGCGDGSRGAASR
ncbi:NagD protein [Streptomyces ambofaciens]